MATERPTRSRNLLIYGGYAVLFIGFALAGAVPCMRAMAASHSEIDHDLSGRKRKAGVAGTGEIVL